VSQPPRIPLPDGRGPWFGTQLDVALADYAAATVREGSLDPVTTELVRLHCARHHDCRLCKSLRTDRALAEGYADELVPTTAQRAALRLADAMIVMPGAIDAELRAEVRAHFTDEQITEIVLDVMKWSFQKVRVALRVEAAPRDGLSVLSFSEDGSAVIGGALTRAPG
jgi:hypothetical protein